MNSAYKMILILSVTLWVISCNPEPRSIFKEDYPDYAAVPGREAAEEWAKYQPVSKSGGEKFTISVIQSDDYPEYYDVFMAIIEGLKLSGWIKESNATHRDNYQTNRAFIQGIQQEEYSAYLEFRPELFFSFMASSQNAKQPQFRKILEWARAKKIDLVILLGTLASKAVFNDPDYNTPTVMDAVSDPLGSGLVKAVEDSGKDFLTARIDTRQYLRQVNLFYNVIRFSRLGLVYEDSPAGRTYGAVEYIEKVAAEKGFSLVRSHKAMAEPTVAQYAQAWEMYLSALDAVCPRVDAVFLGISGGLEKANMPQVVGKLLAYRVPSFAMEGSPAVKQGVMLGVGGKEAGLYNAQKIIRILKGAKPRDLEQNFEKTPRISINLKTAELMNYSLPVDIIRSADEIYLTIAGWEHE